MLRSVGMKIERLKQYFRLKNSFMKMYTNKSVLEKRLALLHSRTAHPYDVCDAMRLWMEWLCAIFNLHTCIHNICVVFFVHIYQTSCFVPLADAYVVELYLRFSFLRIESLLFEGDSCIVVVCDRIESSFFSHWMALNEWIFNTRFRLISKWMTFDLVYEIALTKKMNQWVE